MINCHMQFTSNDFRNYFEVQWFLIIFVIVLWTIACSSFQKDDFLNHFHSRTTFYVSLIAILTNIW
jgi:hypothetical protein